MATSVTKRSLIKLNRKLSQENGPVVAEFAAKNGFDFSVDELITVVEAFQAHQAGQLSDSAFASLLGLPVIDKSAIGANSPLKRFARYMSRTYLGIDLAER